MNTRIGVFICQCGSNISDTVDVHKVRETIGDLDGVVVAKTTMFACADATQKEMVSDIRENKLDALVVASCSPKLHLFTFRDVAVRAGLNPYNYVQVNIREQCSWAHPHRQEEATIKAIDLVRAGVARAARSKPLDPLKIPAENTVAVVGAGIAGIRAALELADLGTYVYLIEKEHFIGGRIVQWGILYPGNLTGDQVISPLYERLLQHRNIRLITGAELISNAGSIGAFSLRIKITPRYVDLHCPEMSADIDHAVEICPEEQPDPFNFGRTMRRAIYKPHPGQYPSLPAIDMGLCTRCGKCLEKTDLIDLKQRPEYVDLQVGAVITSIGFDPYQPQKGEFRYGENKKIVTIQEFRSILAEGEDALRVDGKNIQNIAYIYCVGSRQEQGKNTYCSRYCCTSAIHTALVAKARYPDVKNFHINRGIRTYGKQEILYQQSSEQGDIFIQTTADTPPEISLKHGAPVVKVRDLLTAGRELQLEADLVVLVTGMEPRSDNNISEVLKVPAGRDHFFHEVHLKLRPVETVIDGMYIAGSCQAPCNASEAVKSALSAVAKAHSTISAGQIALEPTLASVDPKACTWCGACEDACPYDAIEQHRLNGKVVARISKSNCKGCGMCLPVCAENALDLAGYSDREIESTIDALAEN